MKKFFLMVLLVSVFFTGLGGMLQQTAAKLKSDERALALLQKARQAIGGESRIAGVNSLSVLGKSTRVFKFEGTERTETGDLEIAMQLPDKMMKSVKIGHGDGTAGEKIIDKKVDVVVVRKGDGPAEWKTETGDNIKVKDGQKMVFKTTDGTVQEVTVGNGGEWTTESDQKVIIKKDE